MKIRTAIIGLAVVGAALTQPIASLAKNGADDPSTHDRGNDRRGNLVVPTATDGPVVTAGDDRNRGRGVDDPATHDVGDDNGADDPATHDVGDDNGGGSGHDDPVTHDAGDDNGSDR